MPESSIGQPHTNLAQMATENGFDKGILAKVIGDYVKLLLGGNPDIPRRIQSLQESASASVANTINPPASAIAAPYTPASPASVSTTPAPKAANDDSYALTA